MRFEFLLKSNKNSVEFDEVLHVNLHEKSDFPIDLRMKKWASWEILAFLVKPLKPVRSDEKNTLEWVQKNGFLLNSGNKTQITELVNVILNISEKIGS